MMVRNPGHVSKGAQEPRFLFGTLFGSRSSMIAKDHSVCFGSGFGLFILIDRLFYDLFFSHAPSHKVSDCNYM